MPCNLNFIIKLISRCEASFGMVAKETIPPLLSVEEASAPYEPDSDCVEKF